MKVKRTYDQEAAGIKTTLLSGFKSHLRITSNNFDANLGLLLDAALEIAEKETGCVFLPSSFTITAKTQISTGGFYPADEVTSFKIEGVEADIDEVYISGGRICVQKDEGVELEVIFDAGYLSIPAPVVAAIYLMAGAMFNKPIDSVEQLPKASTNILKSYRRWQR